MDQRLFHETLDCGAELAGEVLPDRQVAAVELRFLSGAASDRPDRLGVASLVAETADKGTENHDMLALANAFDTLGAQRWSGAGIESSSHGFTVLAENLARALELMAEVLRQPVFPEDQTRVQVTLARQGLKAIEDDPTRKMHVLLSEKVWGDPLGRGVLGSETTLETIAREDLLAYWREHYRPENLQVIAAGNIDVDHVRDRINTLFGNGASGGARPDSAFPAQFDAGRTHVYKDCEQQQLGLAFPALPPDHDDTYVEGMVVAILSGGMSARLFTEVREKRGLAYWVRAARSFRRGRGLIQMGAGTRPERAHETIEVLLAEVDRLGEDVSEEELERAKVGKIADLSTRGDSTHARASAVSGSLFYRDRIVPFDERREKIAAVTVGDVRRYLDEHPREPLCVLTLGTRSLNGDHEKAAS